MYCLIFQENTKRFLKCPAAVSVSILKKLLQGKFDLSQKDAHVDIMYGERILPDDFLLMDIAYKYSWTNVSHNVLPKFPYYSVYKIFMLRPFCAEWNKAPATEL